MSSHRPSAYPTYRSSTSEVNSSMSRSTALNSASPIMTPVNRRQQNERVASISLTGHADPSSLPVGVNDMVDVNSRVSPLGVVGSSLALVDFEFKSAKATQIYHDQQFNIDQQLKTAKQHILISAALSSSETELNEDLEFIRIQREDEQELDEINSERHRTYTKFTTEAQSLGLTGKYWKTLYDENEEESIRDDPTLSIRERNDDVAKYRDATKQDCQQVLNTLTTMMEGAQRAERDWAKDLERLRTELNEVENSGDPFKFPSTKKLNESNLLHHHQRDDADQINRPGSTEEEQQTTSRNESGISIDESSHQHGADHDQAVAELGSQFEACLLEVIRDKMCGCMMLVNAASGLFHENLLKFYEDEPNQPPSLSSKLCNDPLTQRWTAPLTSATTESRVLTDDDLMLQIQSIISRGKAAYQTAVKQGKNQLKRWERDNIYWPDYIRNFKNRHAALKRDLDQMREMYVRRVNQKHGRQLSESQSQSSQLDHDSDEEDNPSQSTWPSPSHLAAQGQSRSPESLRSSLQLSGDWGANRTPAVRVPWNSQQVLKSCAYLSFLPARRGVKGSMNGCQTCMDRDDVNDMEYDSSSILLDLREKVNKVIQEFEVIVQRRINKYRATNQEDAIVRQDSAGGDDHQHFNDSASSAVGLSDVERSPGNANHHSQTRDRSRLSSQQHK